jgi:hypothetical protein
MHIDCAESRDVVKDFKFIFIKPIHFPRLPVKVVTEKIDSTEV